MGTSDACMLLLHSFACVVPTQQSRPPTACLFCLVFVACTHQNPIMFCSTYTHFNSRHIVASAANSHTPMRATHGTHHLSTFPTPRIMQLADDGGPNIYQNGNAPPLLLGTSSFLSYNEMADIWRYTGATKTGSPAVRLFPDNFRHRCA